MAVYNDISQTGSNLEDVRAIMESLDNILSTSKGERLFNRDFGIDIEKYLFSQLTYTNTLLIRSEIKSAITTFEPRVKIEDVKCTIDYENRSYYVSLNLTVKGLDENIKLSKNYFIEEEN